jgi:hypothetical protein
MVINRNSKVFFRVLMFMWDFGLDVLAVSRLTADEKAVEILLLRQQLRIVERKQPRGPIIPRWQKVTLVALVMRLKKKATNAKAAIAESLRLFKPETVVDWHRALVRYKWTFKPSQQPGRPPIDQELEHWIVRLARDNPRMGYDKLEGELRKLGFPPHC